MCFTSCHLLFFLEKRSPFIVCVVHVCYFLFAIDVDGGGSDGAAIADIIMDAFFVSISILFGWHHVL